MTDMISDKKTNLIVIELIIGGRSVVISHAFFAQSYFKVPEHVRISSAHYFINENSKQGKIQQAEIHHSSDIDFI